MNFGFATLAVHRKAIDETRSGQRRYIAIGG
jgi:hypothetical protein